MPTAKKSKKTHSKKAHHYVAAHKHPHYRRRLLLFLLLFLCVTLLFVTLYKSQQSNNLWMSQNTPTTYAGTTPCADCEGIKTTLTLVSNPNTYTLNLDYIGRDVEPFIEQGTWTLRDNIYTLTPSTPSAGQNTQYQVLNANQIRQLDGDGNPIPESLPFTLTKT